MMERLGKLGRSLADVINPSKSTTLGGDGWDG